MFLCVSSSATPRYQKAIAQALAQPVGSQLQFRYRKAILDNKIIGVLNSDAERTCLLAHIDIEKEGVHPEITPCRYAKLSDVTPAGTTVTLTFVLEEYAYAKDLQAFNTEINNVTSDTLPAWKNGQLTGRFCTYVAQELAQVKRSSDLGEWEEIIEQIAKKSGFAEEVCFYTVVGLYKIGGVRWASHQSAMNPWSDPLKLMKGGIYDLLPDHDYELRFYQYYPNRESDPIHSTVTKSSEYAVFSKGMSLKIEATNDILQFITNTEIQIDSPYDIKVVRFRTTKPTKNNISLLSVLRKKNKDALADLDFDLPIKIEKATGYTIFLGGIIGLLLAIPRIAELFVKAQEEAVKGGQEAHLNWWPIPILYIVMYVSAGLVAAFGIKKPISE